MKIIKFAQQDVSYDDAGKKEFHSAGKSALRKIAQSLGLEKGTYDIRSNAGGIAVSGEITLHSDSLYIQIFQSCVRMGRDKTSIMYRTCKGRKDYSGGSNNFMDISDLKNFDYSVNKLRGLL